MTSVELYEEAVQERTFYHLEGMFFNYLVTSDRNPFIAPFSAVLTAIGRAQRHTPYGDVKFVEVLQPADFLDAWAEASARYSAAYVYEWSVLPPKEKVKIRERAH